MNTEKIAGSERKYEEMGKFIKDSGEALGLHVDSLKSELAASYELFQTGHYDEAEKTRNDFEFELTRQKTNGIKDIMECYEVLLDDAEESKKYNLDVEWIRSLYSDGIQALGNGDYVKSQELKKSLSEEIENGKFQHILRIIAKSRSKFLEAKKLGLDLSPPIVALNEARDALKGGKYDFAIQLSEKSDRLVEELISANSIEVGRTKNIDRDVLEKSIKDIESLLDFISLNTYEELIDLRTKLETIPEYISNNDADNIGKILKEIYTESVEKVQDYMKKPIKDIRNLIE